MAKKYLDYDGLLYFWQKIKTIFVSDVTYDSSSKKIQKTKNGTASDVVTLSTVATSGSYNDLSSKPTIPSAGTGTSYPTMDGTRSLGSNAGFARVDHVHPTDTSRAPLASPAFTGTPTAPTASTGTSTTQLATTEFVANSIGAMISGVSDVKIDTTSIVTDGVANIPTASGSAKGLMTSAHYTKLEGIASGAEVNQNAFSNVKVGSTTVAADTKTDTLELVAGSNVTLTPDATNDKITIAATDTTYSNATTSAAGLMSSSDKSKLDNIPGSTLDLVAGNNISITPNTSTGALTIAATDTTYSTGTATELNTGTGTGTRVWTPKVLADYVTGKIATAITGVASFQGTAPTTFAPTGYKKGYYWIVGTAGTYAGQVCEPGDMIFAVEDYGSAYSASDFSVIQTNLDITSITNAEIDTILAA